MNENQSPAEKLKAIIKANFLTAYIDTPTAEEMLAAVKGANLRASIEEMRSAVQELHVRNPDQPPGARDIIRQIQIRRNENGNGSANATVESRARFLQALRGEQDLSARWDMICNADLKSNPNRLLVEKYRDPCQEAARLADASGIEYDRFRPSQHEARAYTRPEYATG